MVAISYNNSNNLIKLHAESFVNRENRLEKKKKIQLTQQNRVKKIMGINLISLHYTLQHKAGYCLVPKL
jgi:uncharacterized protein YbcI